MCSCRMAETTPLEDRRGHSHPRGQPGSRGIADVCASAVYLLWGISTELLMTIGREKEYLDTALTFIHSVLKGWLPVLVFPAIKALP